MSRYSFGLVACSLVILGALTHTSSTIATPYGPPSYTLSTATSASGCIELVPDGSGPTLASLGLSVTVTVRDENGLTVASFPYQDIWLADTTAGSEISFCSYFGLTPDQNTDANGQTTIEGAFHGGGSSTGGLQIYLYGAPLEGDPLPIQTASADRNGDLVVDFLDLSSVPNGFAALYLSGQYSVSIDLNCDGVLNLSDVTRFARHYLAEVACP